MVFGEETDYLFSYEESSLDVQKVSEWVSNSRMESEAYIPVQSFLPCVCFKLSHRAPSSKSETAFHGIQSYLSLASS